MIVARPLGTKPRKLTALERVKNIEKNGITLKDLERAGKDGYDRGFADGARAPMQVCYAAACLAVKHLYGFGQKRCFDLLTEMDKIVMNTLTSSEAVEAVYQEIGFRMNFKEALDRVEMTDKKV